MIIAFSGFRGTGKTSAAKYLHHQYGFVMLSFAARLKEVAKVMFPFTEAQLYGDNKEKPFEIYSWTPRDFMIRLGNFARFYDPDYWIKSLFNSEDPKLNYVIDDLRYKNEAKYLKAKQAFLVRLERYPSRNPYKGNIDDPSEHDLDDYADFDYRFNEVENLTLMSLHTRLDLLMEELQVRKKTR